VIVAGSSGYFNYRHQADACHAYNTLRADGIPASNIILMIYNDIASDPSNPYPGKLFNKPTANGVPGVDVYQGCEPDYTGNEVTPHNFLAVLTGNISAVPVSEEARFDKLTIVSSFICFLTLLSGRSPCSHFHRKRQCVHLLH